MNVKFSLCLFATLIPGLFFTNFAEAAITNITAQARNGAQTPGYASIPSSAVVTCTQATGGEYGTSRCNIEAPGWNGLVASGQSIGTSGAGNVTLSCSGTYAASGGGLSCSASIDDTICSPQQTISSTSSGLDFTQGSAPVKSAAIVQCTQATGGQSGTSACNIQSPGWSGSLSAGQSISTSGAGTVLLNCNGIYGTNGGLQCSAQVSQVCP